MKKYLLLFALLSLFVSGCDDQDSMEAIIKEEIKNLSKEQISPEQAAEIACQFVDIMDSPGNSRVDKPHRKVSTLANVIELQSPHSRSDASSFYLINFDCNQGYAIVSKKNVEMPVLAFGLSGSYSEKEIERNTGFQILLDDAADYIEQSDVTNVFVLDKSCEITDYVLPIVPVLWRQHPFFGDSCPNNIAGCVALAIGQVLCVHRPTDIKITYDGSNDILYLDWSSIASHMAYKYYDNYIRYDKESKSYSVGLSYDKIPHECDPSESYVIPTLIREINHRVKSSFDETATFAEVDNAIMGLKTFGFSKITESVSFNNNLSILNTQLKDNNPAILFGTKKTVTSSSIKTLYGHCWIVDGYVMVKKQNVIWPFYHCNWCKDGHETYCQVSYLDATSVLRPRDPSKVDTIYSATTFIVPLK